MPEILPLKIMATSIHHALIAVIIQGKIQRNGETIAHTLAILCVQLYWYILLLSLVCVYCNFVLCFIIVIPYGIINVVLRGAYLYVGYYFRHTSIWHQWQVYNAMYIVSL